MSRVFVIILYEWLSKTLHVCTFQYFEKYYFRNIQFAASVCYWSCLFNTTVLRVGCGGGKGSNKEARWYKWCILEWLWCPHVPTQWASIPLQDLDRLIPTVGTVPGPHCWFRAHHCHNFTTHEFTWSAKGSLEKQTNWY